MREIDEDAGIVELLDALIDACKEYFEFRRQLGVGMSQADGEECDAEK